MVKHKPFSRTEMKILVYNKVQKGMSYEKACAELEQEINQIIENDIKFEEKMTQQTLSQEKPTEQFMRFISVYKNDTEMLEAIS